MGSVDISEQLVTFPRRTGGSDAERRAAVWLAQEASTGRREAVIETFWCRPSWALAQSWHVALAVAGSLVSVDSPRVGAGMLLVALLALLADWSFGVSPGRRLTFERASQNVVSPPPPGPTRPVQLIITANYDAGQSGLAHGTALRRAAARLRDASGGLAPGWVAWLSIGMIVVLVTALLRIEGDHSAPVAIFQLLGTVELVLGLALLLELASSEWSPGANDNGSGVGVALMLVRALDAAPLANASVTLLLTGVGDAQGLGLRRYLRTHRREHDVRNTVVLGIGPCGSGRPQWLHSDGPLVPMGFFGVLERLCGEVAAADTSLDLRAARGRGCSPALPARMRGLPAISLLARSSDGLVPNSHRLQDLPEALDPTALDATLQAALLLVDGIDAYLGELQVKPA